MSKYIIERPARMPDWVEIGIKFLGSYDGVNWKGPFNLTGYGEYNIGCNNEYRDTEGNWWEYAKPFIPWTPKEGEWVAGWNIESTHYAVGTLSCVEDSFGYRGLFQKVGIDHDIPKYCFRDI
jgi:hypothetical protein